MRRAGAWVALVVLGLAFWAAGRGVAEAHAVLVRSSPAAGAELVAPPAAIDLWFSEPLEARFSTFELLSSEGESLPLDGVVADPTDEYHLSGLPRGLGPGLYTVSYRNVSQSDGHEWSGSFAFTVLNPDGSVPSGQAYQPELGARNSPANILGRWFTFLGFALVAGGVALLLPLHRGRRAIVLAVLHAEASRRVALVGLALLITGGVLVIVAQAQAVPGASVLDIAGGTRGGRLWLWRMLAVEAVAVILGLSFLARCWRAPRAEVATLALLPVAATAGLLTVSLLSHAAAAPGSTWAIASDLIHLVLAALWVGGLATLGVLLWATRRQPPVQRGSAMVYAVAPFATFAAAAVYGLGVTGVVRSLGELPALPALWETEYGRWLLIKFALITPMLGVAFLNRRAVVALGKSPSRGALDTAAARVRRLVPFEVLLGAVVLFSVGVLGQVPTPRGAVAVEADAGAVSVFNRVQQAGDLNVHLQVTPAVVGQNALRIHVYGAAGATIGGIDRVEVTFSRAGALGGEQVQAASLGQGIYTAEGSFLSLALTWQVTVDVIRPGHDDARLAFSVPIGSGTTTDEARAVLGSPAPQLTTRLLGALLALMAGAGLALGWRHHPRYSAATQTAGWVLILGALWVGTTGGGGATLSNPMPGDEASIARGESLFLQQCVSCHGLGGRGDGPEAARLVPPPADLRLHVPLHPDTETYLFITGGVPGTAMQAWDEILTEAERWDLVNYLIAEFGAPASTP